MKKIIIFLFIVFLAGCSTTQHTVNVPEEVDLPEKILFLAQSGTSLSLFQTVIDLENNELVVLEYSGDVLSRVYRTGIIVDPNDYIGKKISSTDAPYDSPDTSRNETTDDSSTPDNQSNPPTPL